MPDQSDTMLPASGQISFPPTHAVARILASFDRAKLGNFVEVAIGLMDVDDGDPELEPNGDERGDQAWIEWNTMGGSQKSGHNLLAGEEDGEDCDPAEDDDPADTGNSEDEDLTSNGWQHPALAADGPGCRLSDPGGCEHDGREEEHEGLNGDVGDYSDGDLGLVGSHGVDQSKPISATNPICL